MAAAMNDATLMPVGFQLQVGLPPAVTRVAIEAGRYLQGRGREFA